jgi:hypothetical protein
MKLITKLLPIILLCTLQHVNARSVGTTTAAAPEPTTTTTATTTQKMAQLELPEETMPAITLKECFDTIKNLRGAWDPSSRTLSAYFVEQVIELALQKDIPSSYESQQFINNLEDALKQNFIEMMLDVGRDCHAQFGANPQENAYIFNMLNRQKEFVANQYRQRKARSELRMN